MSRGAKLKVAFHLCRMELIRSGANSENDDLGWGKYYPQPWTVDHSYGVCMGQVSPPLDHLGPLAECGGLIAFGIGAKSVARFINDIHYYIIVAVLHLCLLC